MRLKLCSRVYGRMGCTKRIRHIRCVLGCAMEIRACMRQHPVHNAVAVITARSAEAAHRLLPGAVAIHMCV